MTYFDRLSESVRAACPVLVVRVGRRADRSTWTFDPDPSATAQQVAAAQAVIDSFADTDAAQAAWEASAAKAAASDGYDGTGAEYRLVRAVAKLAVDEINALRQWVTAFKAAVAAASSLADLKTRVAALPNVPDRTYAQARTAVQNLVNGE